MSKHPFQVYEPSIGIFTFRDHRSIRDLSPNIWSWGFVVGNHGFYVWWWVWMTTQTKYCCTTLHLLCFGHGCQLVVFSAHNWRVEGANWREWSFSCLVIGFFGPFLKIVQRKRPSKYLILGMFFGQFKNSNLWL
jgi:hypothetical protein